jgi:uncharacterized membrane protein YGL010W
MYIAKSIVTLTLNLVILTHFVMKKTILLSCFLLFSYFSTAQTKDSTQVPSFFAGTITATNNGVSLIPSFSLGKPAALFDLSMGKGRWSFDPMLRFGLDGKPWAFVFWGHYKLFNTPQFKMSVGAHPSVVFREVTTIHNGVAKDYLVTQRYLAWEATPTYFPHKKLGFGISYLGSKGLTQDVIQNTTFLAVKSIMPDIALTETVSLALIPQVFFLKMDKVQGTYASAIIGISKKNLPFSISSILSKKLNSQIAGKDFVWNVQLNYLIQNRYIRLE